VSTTLYKEVTYPLKTLVDDIALGEIALPELQRPFVWPNAKVRDLFDSMYRGYPVGFLLFWAIDSSAKKARAIGTGLKQKEPSRLVVDGQQRLTSLFAVLKGLEVMREGGERERIQIAFSPATEAFQVCDAAVAKDPEFIPDISKLWSKDISRIKFVLEFVSKLRGNRDVTEEEEAKIHAAFDRLQNLEHFPFHTLELTSAVDEEQVAEVFVRINSQGKSLNQADFILTLMAVFWDDGRRELEKFCLGARTPGNGGKSAFNPILQPGPEDLLRVIIGTGFQRGRMKYGYSILRGKNLETGETTAELRDVQFEVFKIAQAEALDLTNWHEFLKVPLSAGYVSKHMIGSQVGLLFSYILYLQGQRNFSVDRNTLRNACARWFFMSALTKRYGNSPESMIERDIQALKGKQSPAEFLKIVDEVVAAELTEDFWTVTLPNRLVSSSSLNPALMAYQAALCVLDANALFSELKIRDLLSPFAKGNKSALEKHHLFPKAFLKAQGVRGVRETNQVANYALIEWSDNISISDADPKRYFPEFFERVSGESRQTAFFHHALPEAWWNMSYDDFLEERRRLMAKVIRAGFEKVGESSKLKATKKAG
jgi:hypothetical protein